MRFPLCAGRLARVTLLFVLVPLACAAQHPAPDSPSAPNLQQILLRLQDNVWDYRANVPNFFADEHVVSTLQQLGRSEVRTTTDSIFRLVRSHTIGEGQTFTESREIRLVNKKPAKGDDIRGPAIFSGAFSTAAAVVSLEMAHCYDYTLKPTATLNRAPAILIDFALKPEVVNDESCPGPERQSGRAWIDPANFQTLRVEMVIPNHKDNNGIRVLWRWKVDFAPVAFDSKQFWMPRTITSQAEANDGSAVWAFTADYSNYHKLIVKSRIITDVDDNPAPPPQ